jgi:hypothetical protein
VNATVVLDGETVNIPDFIPDSRHAAALAALSNQTERLRYACLHAPEVKTQVVRDWLASYGYETTRPYASTQVSAYRRERGIRDTAEQPRLTPAVLAELDRANGRRPAELDVPTQRYAPEQDEPEQRERRSGHVKWADRSAPQRFAIGALWTFIGTLLTGVIIAPIALSSQDIIEWAGSSSGLGLTQPWPVLTFLALDAAAAICVGLVVFCTWRGEAPGIFAWLVWVFAGTSAFANYQHGSRPDAAPDAWWFFPAMSLAGPFLLEVVIRRVRKWVQESDGRRSRHGVSFGFSRWVPGVGALRETYGAWRLARLDGIDDADHAIKAYRALCPNGSLRVVKALRDRDSLMEV